MTDARLAADQAEVLGSATPDARLAADQVEVLGNTTPQRRLAADQVEVLSQIPGRLKVLVSGVWRNVGNPPASSGGGDQAYTSRQTKNAGGFNGPTTLTATFDSTTLANSTLIAVVTAYFQTIDWVFPAGWVKLGDMIPFRSQVWAYVNAPATASLTVNSEAGSAAHSQLAVVEYTTTVPSGHVLSNVGYLEHVGGGTSTLTASRATTSAGIVMVAHKSGGASATPAGYTKILDNSGYDGIYLYVKGTTAGETSTAAVGSGQNIMLYADAPLAAPGRLKLLVTTEQATTFGITSGWWVEASRTELDNPAVVKRPLKVLAEGVWKRAAMMVSP